MARLLIVDDDAAGLEIRKLVLERAGHQVFAAGDREQACALFRENQPECVVLDLRLPELEDGLALIREFREGSMASTPARLVILSGWTTSLDDLPERAMVDEVLAKPVRTGQLLRAIAPAI